MSDSCTIRLVIVDNHKSMRDGLAFIVRGFSDLQLVGTASNGRDAVRLCAELQPDVVLMELGMPVMAGIEATTAICRTHPSTRVIIMGSFGDESLSAAALQAGASACLPKSVTVDVLVDTIRTTANARSAA